MTSSDLDLRLQRFRSRRDEYPHALASALIEAGRSNDALEVIHLGLLDDEANLELLTLEGRAFYAQGDLHEAQRSLLRAAKTDPRNKEPYRWLAQVLIERGDPGRAVQVLERAMALDPSDGTLRQAHARAQRLSESTPKKDPPVKIPRGATSAPPRATPSSPRDSIGLRSLSDRALGEPRPAAVTPSALGAAVTRPPANQNAAARAVAAEVHSRPAGVRARGRAGEGGAQDAIAEDLMREPLTDPGGHNLRPAARGEQAARAEQVLPAKQSLPFDDETERDDESPTTAVEVPEELRSYLRQEPAPRETSSREHARGEPARREPAARETARRDGGAREAARESARREPAAHEPARESARRESGPRESVPRESPAHEFASRSAASRESAPREAAGREAKRREAAARDAAAVAPRPGGPTGFFDDDEEDEGSEPTSIVPSERELELLRDREAQLRDAQQAYEQGEDDVTIVDAGLSLADPGMPEPPEQVLGLLEAQGVFEPPNASPAPKQPWIASQELPRVGTPIKRALMVGWGLAVVAALGGYVLFQNWLEGRREQAASMVEAARVEAFDGQHASLSAAAAQLLEARSLDPKSQPALQELLFVQCMQALDGAGDFAAVRETLTRADQMQLTSALIEVARALSRTSDQRMSTAAETLARVDDGVAQDARASLLAGKLAQHTGQVDAQRRFVTRATTLEPRLALGWLAAGEQARAEGQLEAAFDNFHKALGPDKRELRAELWLLVLEAKAGEAAALLRAVEALVPRIEKGSDADKLLGLAVRSFALLAVGDATKAKQVLAGAGTLRVDDPEVLAFFSEQALRAGDPALAYRSARAASSAGGEAARYQATVAAALLQQGDGDAALTALASLGEGHGALALARASAALLGNTRDALEAAKKELASYRVTPVGKDDVEAASLLMRVDLRLGANVESLLPAARSLVLRAPSNAASHLALAAALIAAGQGAAAIEALEPALRLAPGAADAHYLLGLAQRLAGRPNEARLSLERAVAIAPNHVEARRGLGRTLLDGGEFDAALALFRGLESTAGKSATLGVIEALIAKNASSEAASYLAALPEPFKSSSEATLLRARLDMVLKQPLEAVKKLEPLVAEDTESRTADALALYGDALYGADKVDAAAGAYDAALELDDTHPDALLGRAVTAVRADKPDQALQLIARTDAALALRVRPPSVRALWLMTAGHAELQKGQLESARERLARAVTLPTIPSEAYFWYGEVLSRSKDSRANEQYARYLALSPNGPYAARAKRALGTR